MSELTTVAAISSEPLAVHFHTVEANGTKFGAGRAEVNILGRSITCLACYAGDKTTVTDAAGAVAWLSDRGLCGADAGYLVALAVENATPDVVPAIANLLRAQWDWDLHEFARRIGAKPGDDDTCTWFLALDAAATALRKLPPKVLAILTSDQL